MCTFSIQELMDHLRICAEDRDGVCVKHVGLAVNKSSAWDHEFLLLSAVDALGREYVIRFDRFGRKATPQWGPTAPTSREDLVTLTRLGYHEAPAFLGAFIWVGFSFIIVRSLLAR